MSTLGKQASVPEQVQAFHNELRSIRQDLHAHPELGMEETRTSALVADKLRGWGLDVTEGIGKTGVVATARGKQPGHQRAIGLRADMDALPIREETGLPYASRNQGKMHACGHDGHTTMLLGAGRFLVEHPDFTGTVHLIFQPAEEGLGGASAMLQDGLFERFPCDAVYGMHTGPGLPAGKFATRTGPLMAGVGRFEVKFLGAGGHSGLSAIATTDLTIVQANFILGLQTIVEGGLGSKEPAMIRVGSIFGGQREAPAVMPTELYVGGTLRTFTPEVQSFMEHRIDELAHSSAKKQGATAEVNIRWSSPPLINPGEQTVIAVRAAQVVVGIENVITEGKPITAGEDFAFLLKARPGAFVFLGNGVAEDGSFHNIHTPYYNFNDEVIPTGVAYWVSLVHEELGVD